MNGAREKVREDEGGTLAHWCPGCKCLHHFTLRTQFTINGPSWTYNGNPFSPSFHPSMLVYYNEPLDWDVEDGPTKRVHSCHYWLKEGKIQFLSDCEHKLAGQTVDLPFLNGEES